jgi:hypothetical protein
MSPYAELRANGQFGAAGYDLLFGLACQELRLFPVLQHDVADDNAVWDVVGEFLVERGSGVVTMLLTCATDDDSFGALLRTSLRHWLVDQARKTDRGALRRRLERLVSEDDRFEVVPSGQAGAGWWRLAGTGAAPAGPSPTDLRDAAWGVRDIRIPAWSSEDRRAPAADAESLARIMLAVLLKADGSLPPETVVAVFAHRLPRALDPAEEPLIGEEVAGLGTASVETDDPAEAIIAAMEARDAVHVARVFYLLLSAEERRLLPCLDGAIDEQMRAAGRGRSQTYLRVNALKVRLRALLGEEEEEDRVLVMYELRRLCGVPADPAPDGSADMPSRRGSR